MDRVVEPLADSRRGPCSCPINARATPRVPHLRAALPRAQRAGILARRPVIPGKLRLPSPTSQLVYVHGLWLSGAESLVLRRRLEEEFGHRTHAFRYATVSGTMHETAGQLYEFARRLDAARLHFVGHSLGGLVIYRMLERFAGALPPGRVVFLGTPAVGSRAARGAAQLRWITTILGNTVADELLCERERRWSLDRELGIVAGTHAVGLGQFFARFDEPCDGTVGLSETLLPGAADHLALPVSHMGMLLSHDVARQTGHFLDHGRFER